MEDNKLTYYVEINTEDGTQKALKKLMKFNKEAQDAIKGVTEKSSANDKVAGLKKQLDELSKTWDKYNASQRKGDAGSKTIKEFRELEFEAGAFAGRLRQVIKSQDEQSAAATQVYAKLQNLRKEWKMLTEAELNGARGREIISKYNEIMKSSAAAGLSLDSYVKKLQKQSAEQEKSANVIIGLRGEIKNLETQWNRLSLSQQKGVEGKRLKDQIMALRDEYGKYGSSLKQTVINEEKANSNRLRAQQSANSLSGKIRSLTADWNRLTAAQRSGAAGQRVLKQFNDLRTSAGAYAGTLNQAAKNQIKLATSTTATNTGLNRQSRIMSQLTSQIGMYVSVYALQRFATAVRDITAEFELQRVALTAILQDKAAADKIFGQVVELALESPFRIKDIISYTKQLAAYRVETDKLFDTTKRLADISAGLGVDMSRLVLAYGQVRAASVLRGQELRQFTEAGIPLVKLLADKFTELRGVMVSTGEVFELISKRAVPFRMIEEIFNDMTDAGGMFYNMQKIQAETLHGVWANLRDAYDKMYYELGQKNMGLLKGLGNFLRSLADNWEAVYISVKTVVSGYLSYLAVAKLATSSTKALSAAQLIEISVSKLQTQARLASTLGTLAAKNMSNLYMAAQIRLATSTNVLSRAFWRLTAAIMANPIAAAIGLVVAAGTVIAGFAIKANDLDNIIKKLSKSTSEYNKINDEIKPALKTYGDLNKIAAKSEDQTKKQANALATLAQKYPAAITKVDEYGRAIEVSAEMVSKLMLAEEELEKQRIENSNKELLRQKAILVSKMNSLKADINSGYYTQTLSGREGGSQRLPMTPSLLAAWNKEIGELGVRVQKIDVALKGTGSAAAGEIEEALAGLKKYVFELESLEKRAGGNRIKLYDAEEDVSAFGSHIELLEDVAKKYDEASKHAKFYSEQVTNPKISESERETYKNDLRIANAEKELARNILDRYKALDLIKKLKAGDGETEYVKRLREEINVAKDARAAYENYLKTMTEVRAKQTLEGQLKFAGLNFDISDAGAYREYLQNIYDNIKGDPNYDAVRKLIEDIFVDLDTNAIERELKIKLNKIANDIEKTQKANDFFEKVLGITGDIELSKAITIKFTGVAAGEVGDKLREQLQETLQTALGDQALDISGLDILQIEELINKIPDTMTDVKDKAKSFFDKFSDYIRETKIEALELDEALEKLKLDDSVLYGTGVTLDVQKILRDLSMANKKLSKEKSTLEAGFRADQRAGDEQWLNEQLSIINKIYSQLQNNEKTLAQDRLNDLSKTMFEEQKRIMGVDLLLNDIGDKTYGQIQKALSAISKMSEVKLLSVGDDTIKTLKELNIEIDDLKDVDLTKIFDSDGNVIPETDRQILLIIQSLQKFGLTTADANKEYQRLIDGLRKSTEEESAKRKFSDMTEIIDQLFSAFDELIDEIGGVDSAISVLLDNIKKAWSTFKSLQSMASKVIEQTKGGGNMSGSEILSLASNYAAIITVVITMIKLMANEMKKANDATYASVDESTRKITALYDKLIESSGTSSILVEDQIARYKKLSDTVSGFSADLKGDWDIYYDKMSDFEKLVEYVFEARSDISRDIYQYLASANLQDQDGIDSAISRIETALESAKKTGDVSILNNLKAQLEGMKASLVEMDNIIQSMVGDMTNAIMEAMTGLARGSADVLSEFSESLSESLENIVESHVFATIMGDTFAKFKSDIDVALKRGDVDAITKAYADLYEAMLNNQALYAKQMDIAKQIAAEYGIILFESMNTGATEAENLYNNIEEINKAIEHLKTRSESVDVQLLESMKVDASQILAEFEAEKARLWQEYQDLLLNEPAFGDPERTTWEWDKAYYEKFFPQGVFGDMSAGDADYKTRWAAYKELLDDIAEMESKIVSGEAIELLEAQKEAILSQIYSSGYDKYATDEMKQDDTLKEYLSDIELYNQLADDATDPEQQERWRRLAELAKDAFDNAVLDDFNTKLDESLSKFDDNIDKMAFLKNMLSSLSDQTQIDEVKRQLEELEGIVYKDLYSTYADDATRFNDELDLMKKHMEWAIENGYPDLAEWIQKAYDTKILDKWKEGIDEIANGLDDDFDKYKYYQDEIKKAAGMLVMAILGGDETGSADWAARLKYLEELLAELEGSMEDRMWDEYATDAQKYEQELADINKDLDWAIENYPELADEIADAFNTRVLEEWQDAWDDTFGDLDLNLEKLNAIEAALAEVGVPEISEEEARKGRDAALLSGDTEAYNYYQEQLLMHQKINFLLNERAALIEELGSKYQTEEEKYQAEIAQYESDIATFRALLKKAREDGDVEAANRWQKEIEDAEAAMEEFVDNANFDALQEEFKRQFGDISDMGTDEVKKMLDAFKQQIEDSDISEEQKKKILEDIDDIYDDLDKRTQESFNKIGNAIKDISSLLETFGAEQGLVDSISAIGDAVSALGDITYAIAKGDWWSVFSLAVKFVNSLVKAIQNLVSLLDSDPFAGVEAIGVRITNAEKAVQKAVGTSVKPAQESLLSVYQDAIDELNKGIAEEEAKPDGWLARVLGLATDKEAIAEAEKQIEEYEKLMDEVRESMKADFLQTDYTSFSDSLAEILIAPWDSYMEMMDAVKELTDDTINNIVRHALSLHLQSQIKDALDALYERGIGDESLELFRQDVAKIVKDGQSVAKYYGQFYDDLASSSEAYDTISRITESQANSFLGYYQNYLIIMTDMHNIMKRIWDNMNRQSVNINLDAHLTALHTIAANTGAIANNTSRIGAMADDIKIMKNSLARSGAY